MGSVSDIHRPLPPRAMILAAGFGTRLGDLSDKRPKPMLPVCGVPLISFAVAWLRHHGVREVIVNLHHRGEQIEAELGDGSALGVEVRYSRETEILGTGGGLRQAASMLFAGGVEEAVVMNAKIVVDLDLAQVLAFHRERGAEATMVLRPDADADRWGRLGVDASGEVVAFLGREQRTPIEPLMFTGISIVTRRFVERIPQEGMQCVVRTAYRALFEEGRGFMGYVTRGYWWEHSTRERYLEGVRNLLDGRLDLAGFGISSSGVDAAASLGPSVELVAPYRIGSGATIGAGAVIGPYADVGPGAAIGEGARIERSVVWPGAVVGPWAQIRDEVVVE